MPLRPSSLDPLFAPVTTLQGVGGKIAPLLNRLLNADDFARVIDVLFHLPYNAIARDLKPSIAQAPVGETVTLKVRVAAHRPSPRGGRAPYKIIVEDETGDITLAFFRINPDWINRLLPLGEYRYISGTIELWDGMRQMVHPDRILDQRGFETLPSVEPVYHATDGVTSRMLVKFAAHALERLKPLVEWQDEAWLKSQDFKPFDQALRALHMPDHAAAVTVEALAQNPDRRRLAYDELLASQLALALVRSQMRREQGRVNAGNGHLSAQLVKALPYALTASQTKAVADIHEDLISDQRMLRLLQGDVGSGKTIVALLAMVSAVEAGRQAALMAPTEILARQHLERLKPFAEALGLQIGILTGREKGRERTAILQSLQDGSIHLIVGTHALFQAGVAFQDLGLVVVDEQHRFGVHQRLALGSKGDGVDVLVMTATPIPRTLALSSFGDMDISTLTEKPAGRKPIETRLVSLERLDEMMGAVGRAIERGSRVYWVCPLVGESEHLDLAAAEDRFAVLKEFYGEKVGLVHGKMKGRDKDDAMAQFARGDVQILVSTTVIEVGVDVPEANIMVIEHAERFGLAQLHQLRGRVGRGAAQSSCVLLYKGPLGDTAKARLEILRDSEDGFRIAEEDLRLRGEGEMLGTRQSGQANFRLARADTDYDLLQAARDDARLILQRDPMLTSARGEALKVLLYLFERDAAIKLLRAG